MVQRTIDGTSGNSPAAGIDCHRLPGDEEYDRLNRFDGYNESGGKRGRDLLGGAGGNGLLIGADDDHALHVSDDDGVVSGRGEYGWFKNTSSKGALEYRNFSVISALI